MTNSPKPYESVLVANRGEIAVRILKAVRECGLRGIAIHNDLDRDGMHLEYADTVDHLRGEDLSSTYLSPEAIINSARRTGADAIHPGYGFLSERAEFAKLVLESGLGLDRSSSRGNQVDGGQNKSSRINDKSAGPGNSRKVDQHFRW